MATDYQVYLYDRTGALQYVLVPRNGLLSLAYSWRKHQVGFCQFVVDADNTIVSAIDLDWQVAVRRRDPENGIDWYVDFDGLYRDAEYHDDNDGISTFTATSVDSNDWLARAIVAYYSGVNNRSEFSSTPAETVAKTLVTYNATTAGGTADGRVRNVDGWGSAIAVQADGAAGNVIDYTCAWRPLLDSLQEVAHIGGGDYEMVKTGGTAWEFRWYDGQLGTDRSSNVIFSPDADNMQSPTLRRKRSEEYTVAVVAGQDSGTARATAVRTGVNYNALYNSSEVYVDARDLGTALLNARGDVRLEESRARDELTFDVLQTSSTLYGKHYFHGDLVTGYYRGITATKQVVGVTISYTANADNPEKIAIELADL